MKKTLSVILTAAILLTLLIIAPMNAGAQEPAGTVTYQYTFSMTVATKFCAIDYRVFYDDDIYDFVSVDYPWVPKDEDGEYLGAVIHDATDPQQPMYGEIRVNCARAKDTVNFTEGKQLIVLTLTGPANAPKLPVMPQRARRR